MKYRMMDLLCCPTCGERLRLFSFLEVEEANSASDLFSTPRCREYCGLHCISLDEHNASISCSECYRKEIKEGLLTCKCGLFFPIVNNVPRMLYMSLEMFGAFREKYKCRLKELIGGRIEQASDSLPALPEGFQKTLNSFSAEWHIFDYDKDKTWGWDLETRKRIFLDDLKINENELSGKLVFDAGCGNGLLTAALSDFNAEIVGIDISDCVDRAEQWKSRIAKDRSCFVHFIQANLCNPPIRKEIFDFIYSSGVIHHTPDSKVTFTNLVSQVKKDGRVFVWVYGKRSSLVGMFFLIGRLFSRRMSLKMLYRCCRIFSPFYKIGTGVLSALKIMEFRKRTLREITLDLFDAFSPQYVRAHTRDEVCSWFVDSKFKNINISGVNKHGFGVYGDKI